jgi:ABC-type Mn2+/Zn2+ transport system permease subunit
MIDFLFRTYAQNAILIGLVIGTSAALLSPYLVLSQQALIADGLAHVAFTGIILGIIFSSQPFYIALPFVVIASIIVKYLSLKKLISGDATIGVVSAVAFAIGLIVISQSSGFNRVIEGLLVGNIFTVTTTEIILALIVAVVIFGFVFINYDALLLLTYDEEYAKFSKIRTNLLNYGLSVLSALLVVIGVRTIGTLLISAMVIFPSLIASQLGKSYRSLLVIGVISAAFTSFAGIILAHLLSTPAGSTIIVLYAIELAITIIIKSYRKIGISR